MSQLSAISLPPPPARPSTTAMVALGMVRSVSAHAVEGRQRRGGGRRAGGSAGKRWIRPDVEVRDEEVGVGRTDDHDAHAVVGGQLVHQAQHLLEHRLVEQVDRAVVQRDARHAVGQPHTQGLVARVVHGAVVLRAGLWRHC
jgi:hypothetical protein